MKEKIVFFGAGPYVIPVLEALNRELDFLLVLTTEEEKETNRKLGPVLGFCRENNIEVTSVCKLEQQHIAEIESVGAKVAVLASFGLIIPDKILNLFPLGIINIHPSLLPEYRGPTPVQSAILAGETITGVSIMKLDSEVDHGPILVQEETNTEPTDTAESLYKKLFKLGAELIVRDLPKYIAGELKPVEQDHSKATYTKHLTRESGFIDINDERLANSEKLNRMIRAYYPWPGVWFKIQNSEFRVQNDKPSALEGKIIKLLPEQKIQVEGKNVMGLNDFKNGYPEGKEILQKIEYSNF